MGRVIDRKAKATSVKELTAAEAHETEREALMNALSAVIKRATRNVSITDFADRVGVSRPQLSNLLNRETSARARPWMLDTLVAVAREIGCPLSELFAAAELAVANPGTVPQLHLYLYNTEPRSRERLQKLIYEAVGYDGDTNERRYDRLLEILYRLRDVEYANPDFCNKYYNGELSDRAALATLRKAANRMDPDESGEPMPLWMALKEELTC